MPRERGADEKLSGFVAFSCVLPSRESAARGAAGFGVLGGRPALRQLAGTPRVRVDGGAPQGPGFCLLPPFDFGLFFGVCPTFALEAGGFALTHERESQAPLSRVGWCGPGPRTVPVCVCWGEPGPGGGGKDGAR